MIPTMFFAKECSGRAITNDREEAWYAMCCDHRSYPFLRKPLMDKAFGKMPGALSSSKIFVPNNDRPAFFFTFFDPYLRPVQRTACHAGRAERILPTPDTNPNSLTHP